MNLSKTTLSVFFSLLIPPRAHIHLLGIVRVRISNDVARVTFVSLIIDVESPGAQRMNRRFKSFDREKMKRNELSVPQFPRSIPFLRRTNEHVAWIPIQ